MGTMVNRTLGGVEMEAARNKPRVLHVLRSVMLAGAGAVVWMALSSTAASADAGSTNDHSLLSGADSAVTNIVDNTTAGLSGTRGNDASANVAPAQAPTAVSAPAPAANPPAVQVPAVVASELPPLAHAIDQLVSSMPVANVVVPEDTASTVTAPVILSTIGTVDGVGTRVGTLVDGVVAPALDAVGSTADALPVGGLPVTILGVPVTIPSVYLPGDVVTGATPPGAPSALVPVTDALTTYPALRLAQAVTAPLLGLASCFGPPGLGGTLSNATVPLSGYGDPSAPGSPSDGTFPNGIPGDDAGNGSAALPSNPSGAAAAWLPGMNLFHPSAGALESTAAADRHLAPVSFDPGSSPD